MVARYTDHLQPAKQKSDALGKFKVTHWTQLDRFLVLGSEGGSYYATERKLTIDNAYATAKCLDEDGKRVVDRVVEISEGGRAPKNDPALFALAMCAGLGDDATRSYALHRLNRVARIGTHLFHFLQYVDAFRGWGRGLRRAVGDWYGSKTPRQVAFQVTKYQQRDGWSHKDALRLAHPSPPTKEHDLVYKAVTKGWDYAYGNSTLTVNTSEVAEYLAVIDNMQYLETEDAVAQTIVDYRLPREVIPTEWLNSPKVWEALLGSASAGMPLHALIRNLATMTRVGILTSMSDAAQVVIGRLGSAEELQKARVHPMNVLMALKTYGSGMGFRGKHSWVPVHSVVDALDDAFYASFKYVEPTGKRTLIGLDVSGSMQTPLGGFVNFQVREAAAAMALVTAKVEGNYQIMAFSRGFVPVPFTAKSSLQNAMDSTYRMPFDWTDCSLPMRWAKQHKVDVDTFVVYTDSETNHNHTKPSVALEQYRQATGIDAKLVVVGMVANDISIADPNDPGMLDVVGFDSAAPQLIGSFSAGRL